VVASGIAGQNCPPRGTLFPVVDRPAAHASVRLHLLSSRTGRRPPGGWVLRAIQSEGRTRRRGQGERPQPPVPSTARRTDQGGQVGVDALPLPSSGLYSKREICMGERAFYCTAGSPGHVDLAAAPPARATNCVPAVRVNLSQRTRLRAALVRRGPNGATHWLEDSRPLQHDLGDGRGRPSAERPPGQHRCDLRAGACSIANWTRVRRWPGSALACRTSLPHLGRSVSNIGPARPRQSPPHSAIDCAERQ
jgi:hypothetical protein